MGETLRTTGARTGAPTSGSVATGEETGEAGRAGGSAPVAPGPPSSRPSLWAGDITAEAGLALGRVLMPRLTFGGVGGAGSSPGRLIAPPGSELSLICFTGVTIAAAASKATYSPA